MASASSCFCGQIRLRALNPPKTCTSNYVGCNGRLLRPNGHRWLVASAANAPQQRGLEFANGPSPKPKIRAIASDMDGTFLARDHSAPKRNIETVLDCMQRGILFLPATGKSRAGAMASIGLLAKHLTSNGRHGAPGVYIQGLVVHGLEGELVYQRTLPRETARELVRIQRQLRFGSLVAYSGDRIICEKRNEYTELLIAYHEPAPDDSFGEVWERILARPEQELPIHKMLFVDTVERIRELRPLVEDAMGQNSGSAAISDGGYNTKMQDDTGNGAPKSMNWTPAERNPCKAVETDMRPSPRGRCVQACPEMLEVLPLDANKGNGLQRLLHHLGILPSEVLAIGDAENDIEMIRNVGLGVAVGNALPQLKKVADVVLEETNDEAAVAAALERFVLCPSKA
jgi:hydroxymethylpyrimidine pyrophosphatase-like HAD family hydrolase